MDALSSDELELLIELVEKYREDNGDMPTIQWRATNNLLDKLDKILDT